MGVSLTVEWGPDRNRPGSGSETDALRRTRLAKAMEWEVYMERNALARAAYYGEPRPDTPMLMLARSLAATTPPWEGRPPKRGVQ